MSVITVVACSHEMQLFKKNLVMIYDSEKLVGRGENTKNCPMFKVTYFVCIVATVAVSSVINCYNCGGDQGGACADPFKNGPAKTCPPGVTTCIKIKKGHLLLKQGGK